MRGFSKTRCKNLARHNRPWDEKTTNTQGLCICQDSDKTSSCFYPICGFVFTKKLTEKTNSKKYKAWLVVRGFEFKTNFGDTFSSTPHLNTPHFVIFYFAPMFTSGFLLYSIDFVFAFLNAIDSSNVYVTPQQDVGIQDEYCWRLDKALYETARATRHWHKELETFLHSNGLLRSVANACLYYRRSKIPTELIFVSVDNLILCTEREKARFIVKFVEKTFDTHVLGFPTEALGSQISRDKSDTLLSTKKSKGKVIRKFEMKEASILSTPLPLGLKLPLLADATETIVIENYRKLLGELLYFSRCVR